jgi:2-succinyl-5-enolpyruvyl-6-hydroxy-3-cyclohexene-1-carboxylate synthase
MTSEPLVDPRNVNTLWSSVIVETLARCGVRQAVISPGSRSGPLAVAFARHPGLEAIPVLDERSAAFFALGLARQQLRPVALVCTSGTAGANYYPAIIEARESGVPLIAITADRPPELRECAAGQTIDQQKFYGDFVNFYHELALPERNEARLRYLRQTVAHACSRTGSPYGGPVHLNAPFRDPLAPVADAETALFAAEISWERFFAHLAPAPAIEPVGRVPAFTASAHGLIVLGPAQPRDPASFVATVGEIARKLCWPVLADGLSPARNHAGKIPHLITTYDSILRNPAAAERLKPEVVLCLGGWPTSKVLRAWLEGSGAPIWLVSTRPDNRDALHGNTRQLGISLRVIAASLTPDAEINGYEGMWRGYEDPARRIIDRRLEVDSQLFEPKAAWLLAKHLPAGTPLFIASSMPVRDVESVWPANDRQIRPFFNRGANGIDGTLSTALGVAHGGPPAVLLTGDLALLHDSNGFLIRQKFRGSLTIVLINNRGGGIFNHLPVAEFEPPFEEYFATPPAVDFASLAAAHGIEHLSVHDWIQFAERVSVLPRSGIRILELPTDRRRDASVRKQLYAAAATFDDNVESSPPSD